ncbi:hypothetical protein V490_01388 [Pseudogymnoascus sp. VKM F-3557]|nr:hypothetical protein V490_01388 [Pseudogymnoascus sp. VKM F-3557]
MENDGLLRSLSTLPATSLHMISSLAAVVGIHWLCGVGVRDWTPTPSFASTSFGLYSAILGICKPAMNISLVIASVRAIERIAAFQLSRFVS